MTASPDPGYFVVLVDDGGGLPLRLGQDHVDELVGRGDDADLLEVVLHHLDRTEFSRTSNYKASLKRAGMEGLTKASSHNVTISGNLCHNWLEPMKISWNPKNRLQN